MDNSNGFGGGAAVPNVAVPADANGHRGISPTDVSQFVRLDQCRRYLRLRLHERVAGRRFLRDAGVAPQAVTPLLTRSGAAFEARVEAAIARRYPVWDFAGDDPAAQNRRDDNDQVVECAKDLPAGGTVVLLQPRLRVALGDWLVRGDVDLLRLERDGTGALRAVVADVKSSVAAKVEHRLQVAFYREMLGVLFGDQGVACDDVALAVLYRGSASPVAAQDPAALAREAAERAAAVDLFGVDDALLEEVADPDHYRGAVRDLVTGPESVARSVALAPFDAIPFHLTYKCDGCLYNEFCMKRSAEGDDLSLLPHLTEQDKTVLVRAGVATTAALAALKDLVERPVDDATDAADEEAVDGSGRRRRAWWLTPASGKEEAVRQLGATWPVGPRLDGLIHRARRYRQYLREPVAALGYLPGSGYSSLPYSDPAQNPNLVRVYLDAQQDYLADRVYLLGALVVGNEGGVPVPERRRGVVRLAEGPPDAEGEARLFLDWVGATIAAIAAVAAPDAAGAPRAPIHLIFLRDLEQRILLDGLARHAEAVLGATPLYDFVTQLAGFDSSLVSHLDREIRERKNYPMVCQSLQSVAALLGFDWNAGAPYRDLFHARLFDSRGQLGSADDRVPSGEGGRWYTKRARFESQVPLEYAYAAWGDLGPGPAGRRDETAVYRGATTELLLGFQGRRLEAMERIAGEFRGNRETEKRAFHLPDLATFEERARDLAGALDEFVTIERHVSLQGWKAARLAPPEQRVLAGQTLVVQYLDEDQDPAVAARNRENRERQALADRLRAGRAPGMDGKRSKLSAEERAATAWDQEGLRVRLRLDLSSVPCGVDEAVSLSTLKTGDHVVVYRRTVVDSRLPVAEQRQQTPTAKQLLYGTRARLERLVVETDGPGERVAFAELSMGRKHGHTDPRGFLFAGRAEPFEPGERYTLDEDPNDINGFWQSKVTGALLGGGDHALYGRLVAPASARATWQADAAAGQARFLDGLAALEAAGALHGFEDGKRAYIGDHGDAPTLLVQGPPGTGKSYTTAFALFARLQGALAAGRDYRAAVSCHTHAAIDVLLGEVVRVRATLAGIRAGHPAIWARYFDDRLLAAPIYRLDPRGEPPPGIEALYKKDDPRLAGRRALDAISGASHCLVGATPGGVYALVKDRWGKAVLGHELFDALVLDEASQLSLPTAMMAALLLRHDGQLVVVGDHRQMPPIVKHAWETEPRRTFQAYRSYESLFLALRALDPPTIRFAESFRLHADLAEFLRREVYRHDGIPYHSRRRATLPAVAHADPFVAAALAPAHPLVVVVHGEAASQQRNPVEQALMTPLLEALAGKQGLDAATGMGVVVPHRAQRTALQSALPSLALVDPLTGELVRSAVDTVERFQGGERDAIVIGATQSDPAYLLASADFLLDPRRLTVALSRAKRKLVLVASRSVFSLFSADEATFANAQLWKNLLRETCTVPLWVGEREGVPVEVWGNDPCLTPAMEGPGGGVGSGGRAPGLGSRSSARSEGG